MNRTHKTTATDVPPQAEREKTPPTLAQLLAWYAKVHRQGFHAPSTLSAVECGRVNIWIAKDGKAGEVEFVMREHPGGPRKPSPKLLADYMRKATVGEAIKNAVKLADLNDDCTKDDGRLLLNYWRDKLYKWVIWHYGKREKVKLYGDAAEKKYFYRRKEMWIDRIVLYLSEHDMPVRDEIIFHPQKKKLDRRAG